MGIGVYLTPSSEPAGQQNTGFLPVSPAQDAGLQIDDVITSPLPADPPGTPATVAFLRGGLPGSVTVTVTDLLPDPD